MAIFTSLFSIAASSIRRLIRLIIPSTESIDPWGALWRWNKHLGGGCCHYPGIGVSILCEIRKGWFPGCFSVHFLKTWNKQKKSYVWGVRDTYRSKALVKRILHRTGPLKWIRSVPVCKSNSRLRSKRRLVWQWLTGSRGLKKTIQWVFPNCLSVFVCACVCVCVWKHVCIGVFARTPICATLCAFMRRR